jgi:hypothetical protein
MAEEKSPMKRKSTIMIRAIPKIRFVDTVLVYPIFCVLDNPCCVGSEKLEDHAHNLFSLSID